MRVPILMIVPSQEPIRESAMAASEGRSPSIPYELTTLPSGIELDVGTPAVPLGTGEAEQIVVSAFNPRESEAFVVRGHVEVDSLEAVPETIDGRPIFADPRIGPFITCGGSAALGTAAHVAQKLQLAALQAKGLDGGGVALAVMDTGFNYAHLLNRLAATPRIDVANSWTPPGGTNLPGKYPVDHGTMCAFDALTVATQATLLDYPILAGNAPGGSLTGSVLSTAMQAFSQLLIKWAVSYAPGSLSQLYRGLVVSNSWGVYHPSYDFPAGHPGRYIDNPNHPFYQQVLSLTRAGADVVFAAGNCGAQCPSLQCQGRTQQSIMGANAYDHVLTLAGCDTNDQRVGYSSQGPGITNLAQRKPDLTAYTHFLGSEAIAVGAPDTGTSAACPVAAGCVSVLRSKLSPSALPPASLIAQLQATARPVPGQMGWNADYGYGIIDPLAAATSLGL